MAFIPLNAFVFDFTAQSDYPNWTPAQTKTNMNARGEELRVKINELGSDTDDTMALLELSENITLNRKLSATGNFTGTLNGGPITASDAGLQATVVAHIEGDTRHAPDILGTAGQILKVNPGETATEWVDEFGYMILVPESITSGEVALIEVSIPTGYRKLKLFVKNLKSVGALTYAAAIRFNGDTGNNYAYEYANGASGGSFTASTSQIVLAEVVSDINFRDITVDIDNIATMGKSVNGFYNGRFGNPSHRGHLTGAWGNTADEIRTIKIYINGTTIAIGARVEVWGLK